MNGEGVGEQEVWSWDVLEPNLSIRIDLYLVLVSLVLVSALVLYLYTSNRRDVKHILT